MEPPARPAQPRPSDGPAAAPLDSTAALLEGARRGDTAARERLLARMLPSLRNWSHGRLPAGARDLADTDDLVQIALIRAFQQLGEFEPKREGSFLAYLRRIVLNEIKDQIRRVSRRGAIERIDDRVAVAAPSPLEHTIGRETLERYEAALTRLTGPQQEAVILRVEMNFSYPEIADALGQANPNAARMLVARGLVRLAEVMRERG